MAENSQLSTGEILKTSFGLLNRHLKIFAKSTAFFFLPIMGLRLVLSVIDMQSAPGRFYLNIFAAISIVLFAPFELYLGKHFLNSTNSINESYKIDSMTLRVYGSYVLALTVIACIDAVQIHYLWRYGFTTRIVSFLLGVVTLAIRFFGYQILFVSLAEKISVQESWKRSLKIILQRWETSIILMVLYGLIIRISNLLLGVLGSKTQLYRSTVGGEVLSVFNIIVYMVMSVLAAYCLAVAINGRASYYISVTSEKGDETAMATT